MPLPPLSDLPVLDIELTKPIPTLPAAPDPDASQKPVRVLVRLHTHPVASLEFDIDPGGVDAAEFARMLWQAAPQARDHLTADGLPVPDELDAAGLPECAGTPSCMERREVVLRDPPSITIVIATRDREASLRRALSSVAAIAYPAFDVIVVDNAPATDGAARVVAELGGRCGTAPLRYLRENRAGLARAHNRALPEVSGQWVAITDDDVVVDRHWLAAIAESAARPGVACVTGPILPAELETRAQRLIEQAGGFTRGFTPRLFDTGANRPRDSLFPLTAGRFGSGANMAYDTQVLRQLGGFDPYLGAGTRARGGDDLAGFLHVVLAGHTLAYQPSALLWHYHRRDYAGLARQTYNYGVGLGAYLTSAAVHHPRMLSQMMWRSAPGLRHLLSRSSAKNQGKAADFPVELERAERRGLIHGPFAYAASRLRPR